MTHEEINKKITELTASAFDDGYNVADVIGAFENVKSELFKDYARSTHAKLNSQLAEDLFKVCWYGDINTVVGLLECTKIATLDGVANAVTHKKDLAQLAESEQ